MERWERSWALLKKVLVRATVQNSGGRLRWLDAVRPDSQDVIINSYPKATLHAGSGVGGILRSPGGGQMQMRDYPSRNNSVLNCSENDSENDSKGTIPKAENTSEHKYDQQCVWKDQSGTINNTIKAVWSVIRLRRTWGW